MLLLNQLLMVVAIVVAEASSMAFGLKLVAQTFQQLLLLPQVPILVELPLA